MPHSPYSNHTRPPVWRDLEKFRHLRKKLMSLGKFLVWFILYLANTYHVIDYATGQIFIVVNGQRLKNDLAIWSHCRPLCLVNHGLYSRPGLCNFSLMIFLGNLIRYPLAKFYIISNDARNGILLIGWNILKNVI